jgi:signal transduction histidine kinase
VPRPGPTALIIYSGSALAVEVDNQTADAGTPGVEGTGNGIAGMRERVTALGGKFSAGVAPGSREFRVRASFPLETLPPETLPAEAT